MDILCNAAFAGVITGGVCMFVLLSILGLDRLWCRIGWFVPPSIPPKMSFLDIRMRLYDHFVRDYREGLNVIDQLYDSGLITGQYKHWIYCDRTAPLFADAPFSAANLYSVFAFERLNDDKVRIHFQNGLMRFLDGKARNVLWTHSLAEMPATSIRSYLPYVDVRLCTEEIQNVIDTFHAGLNRTMLDPNTTDRIRYSSEQISVEDVVAAL